MPTEDLTLYAKWQMNQSTITFNSNGGSPITAFVEDEGIAVSAPADPARTNYTFAGWHTDLELTLDYTFATMPVDDLTLYAAWTVLVSGDDPAGYNFTLKGDGTYELLSYTGPATVLSIPSAYLGSPVTSIASNAFRHNANFTSITIPPSVTNIGNQAFYNCDGLVTFVMPDTVLTVGEYLFAECNYLTTVTLSASLTTIRLGMFECCIRLHTVTIPESVTLIENAAFQDCESLVTINIPAGVTMIMNSAFNYCLSMTSIVVPLAVTQIQAYVFSACNMLTIYCEALAKPIGWDYNWNTANRPVVWGYGS